MSDETKKISAISLNISRKYSYLPNIRTGPNNHTGWKKYEISIIVQVVINVQVGIFPRY